MTTTSDTAARMPLTVNGSPQNVPPNCSVEELLAVLGLAGGICAVEVNRRVIPRADRGVVRLSENDTVEVVTLVGGG